MADLVLPRPVPGNRPHLVRRTWSAVTASLWRLNGVRPPNEVHRSDIDQLMRALHA
jgi:hypothetical protein